MRISWLLVMTCVGFVLSACESGARKNDLMVYETADQRSAIYVLGDRFYVGYAFEESDSLASFIENNGDPITTDKNGCLRLGPLIIPQSLQKLECSDYRFNLTPVGKGWILQSECDGVWDCATQWRLTSEDGVAIQTIQYAPSVEGSLPYHLVRGEALSVPQRR